MTWAYKGRPEMTKQLADATISVANENNAMVIPVGLAFAKATEKRPQLSLIVATTVIRRLQAPTLKLP